MKKFFKSIWFPIVLFLLLEIILFLVVFFDVKGTPVSCGDDAFCALVSPTQAGFKGVVSGIIPFGIISSFVYLLIPRKKKPSLLKKILIVFLGLVILIMLFLVGAMWWQDKSVAQRHSYSAVPATPSWQGLIPGVSTQADVIKVLGEPGKKWEADGKLYLKYKETVYSNDLIVIKDGKVSVIQIADVVYLEKSVGEIEKKYGKAPKIIDSGYSERSYFFVYPNLGIAFSIDEGPGLMESRVINKLLFMPKTLAEFEKNPQW